jgi:hypothetical protein
VRSLGKTIRRVGIVAVTIGALFEEFIPCASAAPPSTILFTQDFPAGPLLCSFPVRFTVTGMPQTSRFVAVVRPNGFVLTYGGSIGTYENLDSGRKVAYTAAGSANVTSGPDGSIFFDSHGSSTILGEPNFPGIEQFFGNLSITIYPDAPSTFSYERPPIDICSMLA